jgi:pimeloyl-ACP methyl ester carboxylesterase
MLSWAGPLSVVPGIPHSSDCTPTKGFDLCPRICRKEGITSAIFCGCSVGSGIALMIGLDHPELAKALILVRRQ